MHYVDGFTRFSLLRPLHHKCMEEVTAAVLEIFLTFGAPRILHTDNGTEFINEWLQALCLRFHVRMVKGKPYKPNVNGRVEKANRTMKDKIKVWISQRMTVADLDWVPALIEFQYQINTQYRRCIKTTPYKLVFNQTHLSAQHAVEPQEQTDEDTLCKAVEKELLLSDSDDEDPQQRADDDAEMKEEDANLTAGQRVHAVRLAAAQASNTAYADNYENDAGAHRFLPDDWVTISMKHGNQAVHANSLLPARMLMRVVQVMDGSQAKLYCQHGVLTSTRSFGELRSVAAPIPLPPWSKTSEEVIALMHQHKKDCTLFEFSRSDEQILAMESAKYHTVHINLRKTTTAKAKEAAREAKKKAKADARKQEKALFEEFKQSQLAASQASSAAAASASQAEIPTAKRQRKK
jgi:transposase InsO family protein